MFFSNSSQFPKHLCKADELFQLLAAGTRSHQAHSAPPENHFKIAADSNGSRMQLSKFPPYASASGGSLQTAFSLY